VFPESRNRSSILSNVPDTLDPTLVTSTIPLPNVLIVGGTRDRRVQAADDQLKQRAERCPATLQILHLLPETLPFERAGSSLPIAPPRGIRIDDLERAVPNQQGGATRLILTQSTYTIQKWLDLLGPDDMIVASADREALEEGAPEAFQRRGPWRTFAIIDLGIPAEGAPTGDARPSPPSPDLQALFRRLLRPTDHRLRTNVCSSAVRPL
jgi:hypothetical protein